MTSPHTSPICGCSLPEPAPGGPSRIYRQFAGKLAAGSKATQKKLETYQKEFAALEHGSSFDQVVAWYFENVCTGYGYLVKVDGSIRTRQGWLSPYQVREHLGGVNKNPIYLGVKPPGPLCNWAAIDIDAASRYHPASVDGEGIEPVIEAMGEIGLKAAIEVQSSHSEGIHLWYPLGEVCRTWELAVAMESICLSRGLEVRDGVLELRPNQKKYGSVYKGIRAPLTGEGNAIWVEDVGLVDELSVLKSFWGERGKKNRLKWKPDQELTKGLSTSNRRGQKVKGNGLEKALERLAIGFTGTGQTQQVKLAALQVARLVEGIDSITRLEARTYELIQSAPGYEQFCNHQLQIDLGRLLSRGELQKALALSPGGYVGTWKERSNKQRSSDAVQRASDCLAEAALDGQLFANESQAIKYLHHKGGPARSWWKKKENAEILGKLRQQLL